MRTIRGRLTLSFAVVAIITAAAALNLALVYFERRLATLPPEVAAQVDRRLSLAGGDFDGFLELSAVVGTSLAVGLLTALLLAHRFAEPLRAVSGAARRVAAGDLGARAGTPGRRDELGGLVRDFNAMAASLQALERQRADTSAAIAHELRTPLAALTARLQALHDGVHEYAPDEAARLLRHTAVLQRLVEDLRTLSLADAGRLRLRLGRTDLRGTVAEVVAGHTTLARAGGVAVVLADLPDEPLLADVDVDRIDQVIGQLLDNAVRHSSPGSTVTVSVAADVTWAALIVDDEGPGIVPDERARVLERFTQLEAGPVHGGGSGLGLAVVQALVTAHGGRVHIADAPTGGARVRVLLPRSRSPVGDTAGDAA